MKRPAVVLAFASAILATGLTAQAIPEGSQASRIDPGYLSAPHFRIDPFRHVKIPHWGFVISGGISGQNNSMNLKDFGALQFLDDEDENPDGLSYSEILDALGLIPQGVGFGASSAGEGGLYVGGPIGSRFRIGLSAQARAYGGATLDDDFVALLRDGNGARRDFSVGDSREDALATSEYGVHALVRTGPVGTIDGAHITFGMGGRYIIPHYYLRTESAIANGGTIRASGESFSANVDLEKAIAITGDPDGWEEFDEGDLFTRKGSGFGFDFLMRVEWPTSGLAFEAMVANVGKLDVWNVELAGWRYNVNTTNLEEIMDSLDAFPEDLYPDSAGVQMRDFEVDDTLDIDVSLPTIVRFTGTAWANRILQLDVGATLPVKGEFVTPLTFDLGSTWRFSRTVPIRLGLVFGGHQGLGYTGGLAVETRHFLMRLSGGSLGGFMRDAKGFAGRFELGVFF